MFIAAASAMVTIFIQFKKYSPAAFTFIVCNTRGEIERRYYMDGVVADGARLAPLQRFCSFNMKGNYFLQAALAARLLT